MSQHETSFTVIGEIQTAETRLSSKGTQYTILRTLSQVGQYPKKLSFMLFGNQHEEFVRTGAVPGDLVKVTGELSYKKNHQGQYELSLYTTGVQVKKTTATPAPTPPKDFFQQTDVSISDLPF